MKGLRDLTAAHGEPHIEATVAAAKTSEVSRGFGGLFAVHCVLNVSPGAYPIPIAFQQISTVVGLWSSLF